MKKFLCKHLFDIDGVMSDKDFLFVCFDEFEDKAELRGVRNA